MNNEDFDKLVNGQIDQIKATLLVKGKEYTANGDRLHNFKVAAKIAIVPETPLQALWGMYRKHVVSIMDMIAGDARGLKYSQSHIDEKIGDAINYLILGKGLLVESAMDADLPNKPVICMDTFGDTNEEFNKMAGNLKNTLSMFDVVARAANSPSRVYR